MKAASVPRRLARHLPAPPSRRRRPPRAPPHHHATVTDRGSRVRALRRTYLGGDRKCSHARRHSPLCRWSSHPRGHRASAAPTGSPCRRWGVLYPLPHSHPYKSTDFKIFAAAAKSRENLGGWLPGGRENLKKSAALRAASGDLEESQVCNGRKSGSEARKSEVAHASDRRENLKVGGLVPT